MQQPQCLSTSTLQHTPKNLLTHLWQWAMSPASPMSLPVALLVPRCHLPALQYCSFSNASSHCPSPGSQLILRLSTKLPAVLKFSCSCTTLNHSVHPTLVWRRGALLSQMPHPPPTVHLRQSPSHSSPSSSKVKFNYWVI